MYVTAIKLAPKVPRYHRRLGNLQYHLENFNEAAAEWAIALELQPDQNELQQKLVTLYIKLGDEVFAQHKYEGSIQLWRKGLVLDPENNFLVSKLVEAHTLRGDTYYQQGAYNLANKEWAAILELDPSRRGEQKLNDLALKLLTSFTSQAHRPGAVAVVEFTDIQGRPTTFGKFLGEKLTNKLYQSKQFERMVERSKLSEILKEQKLNLSDLVDPLKAQQVGKLVGADALVTGTVSDLGAVLDINARMVLVEKGSILATAGVRVEKDASIAKLLTIK